MKWIRKTFVWASLGCLAATTTASAQPTKWQAESGVSLGRPTPIAPPVHDAVNAVAPVSSGGVQQASYVVRGVSLAPTDEPKNLSLPKDLAPLNAKPAPFQPLAKPVQAVLPPAKNVEIDKTQKVAPERLSAPKITTPPLDTTERIIILSEGGRMVDEQGRSLFGLGWGGNGQWYGQAEFLLWTTRGFHLPPLVTTASPFDPEATRGALGMGTTQLLFGDDNTTGGLRPGARFTLGYKPDPCGLWSIEGSFFFLARQNDGAFFDSNSTPVIARPFVNLNGGTQDRELTTSPGIAPGDVFNGVGTLQIDSSSSLFGAELNSRVLLWCGCDFQLSGLIGFRYLDLNDKLSFVENITSLRDIPGNPGQPPISRAGDQILVFDQFNTHNRFYGGQLGLDAQWRRGPWTLDARAKFALGATHQTVDIDGGQRITSVDGRVQSFRGGLYALPSNIGHFSQTRFGFVPEVGFKVGYNFTENIRAFVGFDYLYWNNVLRPGDQIDQVLDANLIPNSGGPFPTANQVRPRVPFRTTNYWALGLNAGFEIRY